MQLYSQENEGYNYMLTVIDCFSSFAFAKLLKNKSGDEVRNAFQSKVILFFFYFIMSES